MPAAGWDGMEWMRAPVIGGAGRNAEARTRSVVGDRLGTITHDPCRARSSATDDPIKARIVAKRQWSSANTLRSCEIMLCDGACACVCRAYVCLAARGSTPACVRACVCAER